MLLDDFVWRALLAGVGVAAVAAPLGCFVVWRRMAYFGDAIAHSGLLGVSAGLLLGIDLTLGVISVAMALALLLVGLEAQRRLSTDTLLGILSHSALAVGLVAASLLSDRRLDLMAYLFGDILAVRPADLVWIYLGGAAALAVLVGLWRALLAASINEEIAASEGINVPLVRAAFMLLIAFVVAVAMKIVGILLITSLMIIPAAAARGFVRTPEQMAVVAALFGALAVLLGLWGSFLADSPTGPSIVVAAAVLFVASSLAGLARPRARGS